MVRVHQLTAQSQEKMVSSPQFIEKNKKFRFTRVLVENVTYGYNQQPSFSLSYKTASQRTAFPYRSTATLYGAVTPLLLPYYDVSASRLT
jgi:hypothetical protein